MLSLRLIFWIKSDSSMYISCLCRYFNIYLVEPISKMVVQLYPVVDTPPLYYNGDEE